MDSWSRAFHRRRICRHRDNGDAHDPARLLVDGEEVKVQAYNVGGYNYYQLRGLCAALGAIAECPVGDYYAAEAELSGRELPDAPIPGKWKYAFIGEKAGKVTLTFTCSEVDGQYFRPKETVVYIIMVNPDLAVSVLDFTESGEDMVQGILFLEFSCLHFITPLL